MIQKVMNSVLGRTCLGQNPNQLAGGCRSRMLGQERDRNDQREKKHSKSIKILHEEKFKCSNLIEARLRQIQDPRVLGMDDP